MYVLFPQSILDNYRYTDIVTWGHSDEKFILVVGNVVQQRKIVFKTDKVYVHAVRLRDLASIRSEREWCNVLHAAGSSNQPIGARLRQMQDGYGAKGIQVKGHGHTEFELFC